MARPHSKLCFSGGKDCCVSSRNGMLAVEHRNKIHLPLTWGPSPYNFQQKLGIFMHVVRIVRITCMPCTIFFVVILGLIDWLSESHLIVVVTGMFSMITTQLLWRHKPDFRRYGVSVSEWVTPHLQLLHVYRIVNDAEADVFVVSMLTRLSLLRWSLVFEWRQNPIWTWASLPPLPVGFLWLSLSLPSVTSTSLLGSRESHLRYNFDDGAAFVSDVTFAVFMVPMVTRVPWLQ